MTKSKENIRDLLDKDEGLKSKRRLLTISSLILLGMMLSGAKISEANTFILKVTFAHQGGLASLLVLAIMFLLIRYYNYAKPYHVKLYKLWSSRMLEGRFFMSKCEHSGELSGLIIDAEPEGMKIENQIYENGVSFSWSYKCRFPFLRNIDYVVYNEQAYISEKSVSLIKNISVRKYLKVLGFEFKHQVLGFLTHRENLDVLAPYMLGVVAIFSYFFNEEFQMVMRVLLGK